MKKTGSTLVRELAHVFYGARVWPWAQAVKPGGWLPAVQAGKVLEAIVPDPKLKLIKRPCGARGRWVGIKIHIIVTF